MERGIEDAVVMDQKTFKSLTSETRAEILKLLKKRNHTLSEIAQRLKISKTTAKEHLDILVEGRLVEPVPSTNIWKYYTLTKDGRKLVGEEGPKRVVITLVTFVIGLMLSIYGFSGLFAPLPQMAEEIPEATAAGETAVAGGRAFEEEKVAAPLAEAEYNADAGTGAVVTSAVPPSEEARAEEEPAAEPTTMPLMSPYLPLMIGIVGIAVMAMALLMLIRSRRKRSVI